MLRSKMPMTGSSVIVPRFTLGEAMWLYRSAGMSRALVQLGRYPFDMHDRGTHFQGVPC